MRTAKAGEYLAGVRLDKSGIQMLAIGLGAAALGFLIGRLFHALDG
jgi:VIT1/CCC1 family predicted Fe2+/Mn2+ transporter